MKWNAVRETASTGGTYDFFAIVIAALPIVHRLVAVMKDLQPDIKEWLQAQTERARTDTSVVDDVNALSAAMKDALEVWSRDREEIITLLTRWEEERRDGG